MCRGGGIYLGSLNLLAERVGKPLAGEHVGRGEMRKSLPSLFEPFNVKCCRGVRSCPVSVLQMPGREFSEVLSVWVFFQNDPKALERWVCSMASFAFSSARSVKLHVECCEQFMHETSRSPAVGMLL